MNTTMKQITKTVYTFKELIEAAENPDSSVSRNAVEKARQWLQEGATGDSFWYESITDEWTEALEKIGFEGKTSIAFSGFASQGDGASFTCNYASVEKLLKFFEMDTEQREKFIGWKIPNLAFMKPKEVRQLRRIQGCFTTRIARRSSPYSHSNTVTVEIEANTYERHVKVNALLDYFQEFLEEFKNDLCHEIYSQLEREYEWRMDDEQLIEDSEANEYHFDECGRIE